MPITFTRPLPDSDAPAVLAEARRLYHPELDSAGVTVGLLLAWPPEDAEDPQALKLHGYPCAATVRITPYRQRVLGVADALVTIDGNTWKGLADAEKLALLDHELAHLVLVRDDDLSGAVKADDCGRPRLRLRLHDWQLGGFDAVAARHGRHALEVQALRAAVAERRQAVFGWSDDMALVPEESHA